jgi:tripartite-type tricarboxylate transporter receptor subunit TctC
MLQIHSSSHPHCTLAVAAMATIATVSVALGALPGTACAQDFPSKPIRLVVGFPPGGSNDLVARVIAPRLAESLGQPVIIENRPGANATIGTAFVAAAAPDGYVLTLGSVSPLVLSPFTYDKLAYDTQRDFAGVSTVALTPEVIALHPSVPVKTMKDLIALARKRQVSLGSAGNGGLPHLAIELLKNDSKTPFLHVPFKGAAPAVSDAVAGHVDGIIMDLPAASTMIRDGRLRAIAVTNTSRSPVLPDTPTSVEQGFPAVTAVNWFALMAPAKTPRPVLDRLHKALIGVTQLAAIREQFAKMGIEPFTQASPDAFTRFLADEMVRWGALVKSSGAKASD